MKSHAPTSDLDRCRCGAALSPRHGYHAVPRSDRPSSGVCARCRRAASWTIRLEVWRARASGENFKSISERLGAGLRGVEFHWRELCRATGSSDVADMTRLAVKLGVISI